MENVVVIISANIEWEVIEKIKKPKHIEKSQYGEYFFDSKYEDIGKIIIYFQGGWGKISAAGSTQYIISRWKPSLIINLGTCGGFKGFVNRGDVFIVNKTIVYDIFEQMGNNETAINHYTTTIDLDFINDTTISDLKRVPIISGDRDINSDDVELLHRRYGAIVGDWESGAIAWICARNKHRLIIMRGVTDLVGKSDGEAYGNIELFKQEAQSIMCKLVDIMDKKLIKINNI